MRTIDRTPYLSENGEISLVNQARATLKYGSAWLAEIKAQQVVVDILNRQLAKGYTLLRNITLPGTQFSLPLVLVGPAGVFTLLVTPLKGTYQARGDVWGEFSGDKVSPARSNLLLLASKLARAVSRYLEKQGAPAPTAEGILLAADPGLQIESARPIVRVVMRDGIEYLVSTINQAPSVLSPTASQLVVDLLTDPSAAQRQPAAPIAAGQDLPSAPAQAFAEPAGDVPELDSLLPWSGEDLGFEFMDTPTQEPERPFTYAPEPPPAEFTPEPVSVSQITQKPKRGMDKKQWGCLIAVGVIEIILVAVFFGYILLTQ